MVVSSFVELFVLNYHSEPVLCSFENAAGSRLHLRRTAETAEAEGP